MTQGERIASLETTVAELSKDVQAMNGKLDDLLALRNKGAGAFWLASTIFGTSLIGILGHIFNWFR